MIHLDTGLLIALVKVADAHHATAAKIAKKNRSFSTSSVAWMEFLSRPVPPAHTLALKGLLAAGIVPFDEPTAALAGEIFYQTGSNRRTRLDAMIAATAIRADAELATVNREDFEAFVPFGLKLLP